MTTSSSPIPPTFYISFYGGPFDGLVEPFTADPGTVVHRLEIQPHYDPAVRAVYVAIPGRTEGTLRPLVYGGTFTP